MMLAILSIICPSYSPGFNTNISWIIAGNLMQPGRGADHLLPWQLQGVATAHDPDALAVHTDVGVINDPAPCNVDQQEVPNFSLWHITAQNHKDCSNCQCVLREREVSLDIGIELAQGGVVLQQVRCLLHTACKFRWVQQPKLVASAPMEYMYAPFSVLTCLLQLTNDHRP